MESKNTLDETLKFLDDKKFEFLINGVSPENWILPVSKEVFDSINESVQFIIQGKPLPEEFTKIIECFNLNDNQWMIVRKGGPRYFLFYK